ncbi:hypothetical protein [Cryobacterium cryoconiti]|uniref:Uncharacterized protein n=1 Tax=Cryobacterium cryoconiti TaxID=1259239 RepID=A0A4Y8JU67_9MICO|nr:hypothetical protein [Cryobacterium cryoconiti]TFD27461.1 hypothetical protein E3T49_13030 [Cryobacterium cryoconiti]
MSAIEIQTAITTLTELRDAGTPGPFFLDDCEGEIRVYPERLLPSMSRDESGEITSWTSPGSWQTDEMVISYDVESWDPGENTQDDRMRANAETFVILQRTINPMLAVLQVALTFAALTHNKFTDTGLELARAINGTAPLPQETDPEHAEACS